MKYIIMCAGSGTRWNNYLGVPKHLVSINGETLLGRTTRLLKERGITDYVITSFDKEYKKYGKVIPQSYIDCEIDRFEDTGDKEICYLYGDVYYTENAIDLIVNTDTKDILFFGNYEEIFAIKIKKRETFFNTKYVVKSLYQAGVIKRCIGWELYRALNNLPFEEHTFGDKYLMVKINDETNDLDYPEDYDKLKARLEK